jgi:hypothetical protein
MKKLFSVVAVLTLAGCASSATQYYEAVQKAAESNALAAQAKFEALSKIASAGDGQAASAAVMALALTQTPTITPVPQQSAALQWASVLAAPVSNLGMMWMQNDATKTMAKYNARVDMARISADAQTEQALYGAFADTASVGYEAIGNVDYTPFINGMVDLGTAGIDGAVTLGTVGMDNLTTLGTETIDGMVTLDAGNNALYGSVWSSYTQGLQGIIGTLPDPVTCSVGADGAVTCN